MKKVLRLFISLSLLLVCAGTMKGQGAEPETVSLILGYCNPEIAKEGKGYNEAGLVSAAIYFPEERMQKLAGNKITKVKYGLVQNRMSSMTFFIKDDLTGKALYQQTTTGKPKKGWNEIVLDIPYVIRGKGIYVGIEYNQISKARSFSFTGSEKPYGAYLAFDNDWIDFYGNGYGSLSLQCVVEGESLPKHDINFSNVTIPPYVPAGESFSIKNEFGNFGTETIKEFDFIYQINEDDPVTVHKEVELPTGSYHALSIDNIMCPEGQVNNIKVKIENPNGHPDENQSDNEQAVKTYTYSKTYPRTTVLEQFTTEKCTNCPAGTALLKTVLEDRSDVIWIAHHAGYGVDKYTIEASEDLLPLYGAGGLFAPAMMIDRSTFDSNFYPVTGVSTSAEYTESILKMANEVPAFATVEIIADYNESTRRLNIEVSGDVLYFAGDDPRITVYITEDSLFSTTQGGAREYFHNHVPRIALTKSFGDSCKAEGNTYKINKECTISADWKPENLRIVAFLSNYDKLNVNNRKIFNAAATPLIKPTSITNLSLENISVLANGRKIRLTGDYDSFEIFTISGQKVPNDGLIEGVYLVRIKHKTEFIIKKVVIR